MEKIINVKVSGSEIEQSAASGGIQGEGGARSLCISFDEEWSAYSKSVTFLDANLKNAVKVYLTTANLSGDGSYTIPIPADPLKTGGKFTYIIDGSAEGVLQRSVKKELKVKYAPVVSSASLPSEVTPSQADQLNLSIQNEAERITALETRTSGAEEEITALKARADLLEETDETVSGSIETINSEISSINAELAKKAGAAYVTEELSKKADKTYVDAVLPVKASELQASEGTDDSSYMTPLQTGNQIKSTLAASLVNTPEIYTKETTLGMNAITGMKHGDMCIILSGNTSAQSIYRYYTKDINGNALSTPQWVWLTDLSLFAPLAVLELTDSAWDYSKGNTAKLTLSADTTLSLSNVKSGDYGVLDVYGGFDLTLPENSYAFPPDWDYLAPEAGQHYRYSFFYDGSKFDWNRSVRNNV